MSELISAADVVKVQAQETSFQFSVYEMTIQPGKSIPLHIHPFAEFFYCLDGRLDVMQVDTEGLLSWVPLTAGECANAPSNAPHGVKNRSDAPAKFLSVSTPEHQKAFDEFQAFVETPEGAALSEEEKGKTLTDLFAKYNTTFLDAHEK